MESVRFVMNSVMYWDFRIFTILIMKKAGVAPHPGDWSLMASGSYLNNSKTPPSYSAYERYMVGWGTSERLKVPEIMNYRL